MAAAVNSSNQKSLRRSLFGGRFSTSSNNARENDENLAPGFPPPQMRSRCDVPDDDDLDIMMMEEMMSLKESSQSASSTYSGTANQMSSTES